LNLPVEPFTEDGSWLDALDLLLPAMASAFAPDLIVSQHGCDSHAWDPLTHLRLSTRAFAAQARLVHQLAHAVAGGRWVATGGGGYDWARVVPRSWVILWADMSGQPLPVELPSAWVSAWTDAATREGFMPMPSALHDDPEAWGPVPRRAAIEQANRERAEAVHRLVLALQPVR
jgi:acetoin utilization protein AcuC